MITNTQGLFKLFWQLQLFVLDQLAIYSSLLVQSCLQIPPVLVNDNSMVWFIYVVIDLMFFHHFKKEYIAYYIIIHLLGLDIRTIG